MDFHRVIDIIQKIKPKQRPPLCKCAWFRIIDFSNSFGSISVLGQALPSGLENLAFIKHAFLFQVRRDDLVLSKFHCHDCYRTTSLISALPLPLRQTRHTKTKLVRVRNALLPVLRCDPTAQEVLCSCTTFPTVTAALNGRMSCFEFSVRGQAPLQASLATGRILSATKQGGYTFHIALQYGYIHIHTGNTL